MTLSHAQVPPHHLALSFHSFSPGPPRGPGPSLLSDWPRDPGLRAWRNIRIQPERNGWREGTDLEKERENRDSRTDGLTSKENRTAKRSKSEVGHVTWGAMEAESETESVKYCQ